VIVRVDTPKVVVDTPAVVIVRVDTPKVVVDTPAVVIVKVDTPKVVVDTPAVVVVKIDTPAVVFAKMDSTPHIADILIQGTVKDEKTGSPLGAEVVFYANGKELQRVNSNPVTGAYQIIMPAGVEYGVVVNQPYYLLFSDVISTTGKVALTGNVTQDILMRPIPMEVGQTFVLKNIYFDLGNAVLKPESREELTRLYDLLRNYPTLVIEVKGHTDSQAGDEYNQALSEARASAVVNYLKYKGVMGYRLSAKGFGEKAPVAPNETEEGRALNRRVEFTIVRM
jgi:OmpA-OmpF porin, OOP family